MTIKLLIIALGGALGTLLRAGLSWLVQRHVDARFPWGTVAVNVVGCFLFGLVWALTEAKWRPTAELRLFLLTGFLGAFTTFSTYLFDCAELAGTSRYAALVGNIALQNVVGLAFVFAGLALGRAV
jgi:CrcB protein